MKRPIRPPSPQSRPSQAPSGAVVVNGYSARWLNQDFCWVYPAELVNRPQNLKPGQAVKLCDEQGKALGAGLWDEGWISVRRYRADDGPIDAALIHGRLDVAYALRQQIVEPNTNAYRLVNAENDELPGLRVDIWGHYATITLDAPGVAPLIELGLRLA
jgi:23S rRNA (cytosine1962-C5)-methyltransferase